jgi:hypothetical protein
MDSGDGEKDWNSDTMIPDMNAQPAMPNMAAMPANQGLYGQQQVAAQPTVQANVGLYEQHVPQHTGPALSSLPGNMEIAPQHVVPVEPTVVQQWTDDNGHTWRSMSDGSTLWWNGADWQRT